MWRWVGTVALALLAAFYIIGLDSTEPNRPGDPAAAGALTAVTKAQFNPSDPAAVFPADWQRVMGYLPRTALGPGGTPILIKPAGDCSAPNGPTEYDFDVVCKEHDLSYDVLRYAGLIGRPLPPAARATADDMFDRELHGRCDQLHVSGLDYGICHTYAESFAVVVKINSWRQGYRPPGQESPWKWTALVLLTGSLVAIPMTSTRLRRSPALLPWHPAGMLPGYLMSLRPDPDQTKVGA
jgi:hypothetical protein